MIGSRPEFSRSVPLGRMLLINAILKETVRAALVRPMMESDVPLLCRLNGTCHVEGPNPAERQALVGSLQPEAILLDPASPHDCRLGGIGQAAVPFSVELPRMESVHPVASLTASRHPSKNSGTSTHSWTVWISF